MKKQDYLLFAIIIIAFIIWMYIVQKYFTVSYDELTIEEKIRYEQFMLPWKESERMSRIIINYDDDITEQNAIYYVDAVISMGRYSGLNKESYCHVSQFKDGTFVFADVTKSGTDVFRVSKGEWAWRRMKD